METWMTIDECVKLFRLKKPGITMAELLTYFLYHGVKRLHKTVGRRVVQNGRVRAVKQLYLTADVHNFFEKYKPKSPFTYRVDSPPPDGWYTLRYIADYLGANYKRLQKLCSMLTIPARIYQHTRYARLDICEHYLQWRQRWFVKKHRSPAWITARLKWQKEMGLEPPTHTKNAWSACVFAPELIHL